jgi:hypothetical protein
MKEIQIIYWDIILYFHIAGKSGKKNVNYYENWWTFGAHGSRFTRFYWVLSHNFNDLRVDGEQLSGPFISINFWFLFGFYASPATMDLGSK